MERTTKKELRARVATLEEQIAALRKNALHTLSCYMIEGVARCERGCAARLIKEVLEKKYG